MGDHADKLILAVLGLIALSTQIIKWASEKKREESLPEPLRKATVTEATTFFSSPRSSDTIRTMAAKIDALHEWHEPVKDPVSGQPTFRWYVHPNHPQLQKIQETMDKLLAEVDRLECK